MVATQPSTAKDPCHCKHAREWHNACSKCLCPFFIPQGTKGGVLRLWKVERQVRELREAN